MTECHISPTAWSMAVGTLACVMVPGGIVAMAIGAARCINYRMVENGASPRLRIVAA
jgi:hypothetical protein